MKRGIRGPLWFLDGKITVRGQSLIMSPKVGTMGRDPVTQSPWLAVSALWPLVTLCVLLDHQHLVLETSAVRFIFRARMANLKFKFL